MKLYKYLKAEYALAFLRSRELKVAILYDANDPNEWAPNLKECETGRNFLADKIYREVFKKHYGRKFGFISFSDKGDNPLLWAHYGDRFRGIALEFEITDEDNLVKVCYSNDQDRRPVVSEEEILHSTEATLQKFISTKARVWDYESEWRIIVLLDECRVLGTSDGTYILTQKIDSVLSLSGVVLGSECEISKCQALTELEKWQENAVSICRLIPDEKTYAYHIVRESGEAMCANKV